jgi:hypothetical protein
MSVVLVTGSSTARPHRHPLRAAGHDVHAGVYPAGATELTQLSRPSGRDPAGDLDVDDTVSVTAVARSTGPAASTSCQQRGHRGGGSSGRRSMGKTMFETNYFGVIRDPGCATGHASGGGVTVNVSSTPDGRDRRPRHYWR